MGVTLVCAHILYSGTVQGVGFRFTVQRYALNLDLTGWVKNISDGSVEIIINGPKANIEELCQSVEENFAANIRNKNIQYAEPSKEFIDFLITY